MPWLYVSRTQVFLSTPSARRATKVCAQLFVVVGDFYPRPPRGGRPSAFEQPSSSALFLSTPSARRATSSRRQASSSVTVFLSTPSARRATSPCLWVLRQWPISIHALREEGDARTGSFGGCGINFYPRPPRGGRPGCCISSSSPTDFYPRPPRGGRQQKQRQNLYFQTNYTTFCTNLEEP